MSDNLHLPWTVGVDEIFDFNGARLDDELFIVDANGDCVENNLDEPRIRLIVHAVNNHARLVEALRYARSYVKAGDGEMADLEYIDEALKQATGDDE